MNRLLIAAILILGSFSFSMAQTSDFRGFAWGASIAKVQSEEKATLTIKVSNDELEYKDILGGSDCNVIYIFNDNDKLASGLYLFQKKYSNPQLYIQNYNKFKALLSEKYGKPGSEKETWNLATPLAEKQNYGQAIAEGNLSLNTVWTTNRSVIKIALVTVDQHPSLQIHYTARSMDELEDKAELRNALNKL